MTATAYDIATSRPDAAPEFSPRQQVVLQHALTLLVEGGEKALTTAHARRAPMREQRLRYLEVLRAPTDAACAE